MVNQEERDARGIGTGKWTPVRQYIVTLTPVGEKTVWGATHDGTLKIVTTKEDFEQGRTYLISGSRE